jgi:two-component sensor histidine kinase
MAASERVQIIGRVHQQLTPSGEVTVVDVGKFISELCEDWRANMIGLRPIVLRVEVVRMRSHFLGRLWWA